MVVTSAWVDSGIQKIIRSPPGARERISAADLWRGYTLWHHAAANRADLMQADIDSGADPHTYVSDGDVALSPIDVAVRWASVDAVKLLLKHGVSVETSNLEVRVGVPASRMTLLMIGACSLTNYGGLYDLGRAALHQGYLTTAAPHAGRDAVVLVRTLLESGADVGTECVQFRAPARQGGFAGSRWRARLYTPIQVALATWYRRRSGWPGLLVAPFRVADCRDVQVRIARLLAVHGAPTTRLREAVRDARQDMKDHCRDSSQTSTRNVEPWWDTMQRCAEELEGRHPLEVACMYGMYDDAVAAVRLGHARLVVRPMLPLATPPVLHGDVHALTAAAVRGRDLSWSPLRYSLYPEATRRDLVNMMLVERRLRGSPASLPDDVWLCHIAPFITLRTARSVRIYTEYEGTEGVCTLCAKAIWIPQGAAAGNIDSPDARSIPRLPASILYPCGDFDTLRPGSFDRASGLELGTRVAARSHPSLVARSVACWRNPRFDRAESLAELVRAERRRKMREGMPYNCCVSCLHARRCGGCNHLLCNCSNLVPVEPEPESEVSAEDFSASESFDGPREGWVFKSGPNGTGYYRDAKAG